MDQPPNAVALRFPSTCFGHPWLAAAGGQLPHPDHHRNVRRVKGLEATRCVTPRQTCPQPRLRAQLAFKDSMVHGILQFTPSIAFRYVLHRCESRDIRCRESFRLYDVEQQPEHTGTQGYGRMPYRWSTLALRAPGFVWSSVRWGWVAPPESGAFGLPGGRAPPRYPGR